MPGLDPRRTWRVEPAACQTDAPGPSTLAPAWLDDGFVEVRGDLLADHGITLDVHQPATATVLAVRALGADTPSVGT